MDLNEIMQQAQGMASRMKEMQEEAKKQIVTGEAGGGMVTARMTGAGELVGLEIDPSVIDPGDPEILADLVIAAVNLARKKQAQVAADSMQGLTGGFDLSALGIDPGAMMP